MLTLLRSRTGGTQPDPDTIDPPDDAADDAAAGPPAPAEAAEPPCDEPAEVVALRHRLAAVPGDWLDGPMVDAYLVHARKLAARRLVEELLSAARADRDAELAAVLAAPSPATAGGYLQAGARVALATAALDALPPAELPPFEVAGSALERARAALAAADRGLDVQELAYVRDRERWRQASVRAGQPLDPPVFTAEEQRVLRLSELVAADIAAWRQSGRIWAASGPGSADPLDLLASAVGMLGQASDLGQRVSEVNGRITRANALRPGITQ